MITIKEKINTIPVGTADVVPTPIQTEITARQSRAFRSETAAVAYRDEVAKKYNLPKHYSQADLDDGTLVQVGNGRHVPVETIVKEDHGKIHVSSTGKTWYVTATPYELEDVDYKDHIMERDLSSAEELDL